MINSDREQYLSDDLQVNLDQIKIYVSKDEESRAKTAMYVSKTLTVNALIYAIAARYYMNTSRSHLQYLDNGKWE
jgi:hypothetical protein